MQNLSIDTARRVVLEVVRTWPPEVDVATKKYHLSGGCSIPRLVDVREEVLRQLEVEDDDPKADANWAIFTLLHKAARSLIKVVPEHIDQAAVLDYLKEKMNWNVED
jgi:hypothetical protein